MRELIKKILREEIENDYSWLDDTMKWYGDLPYNSGDKTYVIRFEKGVFKNLSQIEELLLKLKSLGWNVGYFNHYDIKDIGLYTVIGDQSYMRLLGNGRVTYGDNETTFGDKFENYDVIFYTPD